MIRGRLRKTKRLLGYLQQTAGNDFLQNFIWCRPDRFPLAGRRRCGGLLINILQVLTPVFAFPKQKFSTTSETINLFF